jgi:hypothetical protein
MLALRSVVAFVAFAAGATAASEVAGAATATRAAEGAEGTLVATALARTFAALAEERPPKLSTQRVASTTSKGVREK